MKNGYHGLNKSATQEFKCFRDVRQGDPFAPLLFLVVLEALCDLVREPIEKNLHKGYVTDKKNCVISIL